MSGPMAPTLRTPDLRPLHRRAIDMASTHVSLVTRSDLVRPTPCAGWDVAVLLTHMVGQQRGFTAAVTRGDAPRRAYVPAAFSTETWRASADALVAAFGAADLDATVRQVELAATPLPLGTLVAAHLLDTVVHTWDLARALGLELTPPDDLAQTAATLLPLIPDDEGRRAPGAAFGPALATPAGSWERVLAWLGRDPAWTTTDAAA